jgi:hypothetical protein
MMEQAGLDIPHKKWAVGTAVAHSLRGQIRATPMDPRIEEGVYRTLCLPAVEAALCDFSLWAKTQRDERSAFMIKQIAKPLGGL